jgi:hypothetical protein
MTLGVALVVTFVLYVIDKHDQWRTTAKIAAAFVALALLSIGGYYGHARYEEYREERRERFVKLNRDAAIKACLARFPNLPDNKDAWLPECEENPDRVPCWSEPDAKSPGWQFDQNSLKDKQGNPIPPDAKEVCYPPDN